MPRPVILGVVGDSAAGKTTITRGLVRILGEDRVTHVCTDDYHRYDRKQRADLGITPLHPDCNYIDIAGQDLEHLRGGRAILKPVYRHADGTFGAPVYVKPHVFTVVEGLLGYHTPDMRECYDVRVYLAPPEDLRRRWKVQRDCSRRGYTTDEVLAELDRREPDSAAFIRPQERYADMVISFLPGEGGDPDFLDAEVVLREGLPHPDLSPFIRNGSGGFSMKEHRAGAAPVHPGRHRPGAGRGDRGGHLGSAAFRDSPAQPAAGRVHDRHRPAPLGVARAGPALDPLPPGDGARGYRAGRARHASPRAPAFMTPEHCRSPSELRRCVRTRGTAAPARASDRARAAVDTSAEGAAAGARRSSSAGRAPARAA